LVSPVNGCKIFFPPLHPPPPITPSTSPHLTTPPLFRDSVVTVSIAEWDLTCNLFNGETASGPVPRLFAANPEEAHAALISDEARAFRDLQRIMAKFFVPENIPPHKAWDFLNNIR
jgi:hypothetical protein